MATVTNTGYGYFPDFIVTPGAVLQETIDSLGMTQAGLATRTGLSRKTVNQIIQGEEPISHETALRLERVTNVPAHFWNNLEAKYRERVLRAKEQKRLAANVSWLKTIPIKELVKRGAVEPQKDDLCLVAAVLAFFGVNSPQEWNAVWGCFRVAFRKSPSFDLNLGAVATWLRLGELEGRQLRCQPYDLDRFKDALKKIRGLTTEDPEVFVPRIRQLCADAGVAVVLVPEIRGAPVWGAAHWLSPEKALLQLALRGKTDDLFWFAFFHEAGHILKHGKKAKFVDDGAGGDTREDEANRFASDFLIPRGRLAEFRALRRRNGRLQAEGLVPWANLNNDLKVRLSWTGESGNEIAKADE
jgi:HTH-type transcriptional regulator / antitoxin HigA